MKFLPADKGISVDLTEQRKLKGNALFVTTILIFLLMAFMMISGAVEVLLYSRFLPGLLILGLGLVYSLAAYRYLEKVTKQEFLFADENQILIIRKNLLKSTKYTFAVSIDLSLTLTGKIKMKDHPMKTGGFDYLGFQTQQEVIESVHDDGNLKIESGGTVLHCAVGLTTWDAEALSKQIYQATNRAVTIQNIPDEIPAEEWQQPFSGYHHRPGNGYNQPGLN